MLSARCHDDEANLPALNLANDIVEGRRSVEDARRSNAHEFLAYRKKEPTPYMEGSGSSRTAAAMPTSGFSLTTISRPRRSRGSPRPPRPSGR